ncbi:hypothetical protein LOTGIDRAFT_233737 [Lottia gigantea]|uniref:Uncharacterized protein n=1 Tax=Lottia gigantea TaxID=225164 RepID=V3ZHF9_LOTGI|nr:hypothetical protein LOTGIDRAFT_233737 [Lottia gigantea]ESO90703.1 hypothetical protein LOTGIDRAFT_233737 [Lottia gigantea]
MEKFKTSPSPEKRDGRPAHEKSGRLSSRSNTPDIVANTTDNTSSDDYYDEPTNSTNTSLATTPVCCIDSKSHHLPPPPSQFPAKFNVNSYPICDIPMQNVPSVPYHQVNLPPNRADQPLHPIHCSSNETRILQQPVIYANTPSNRGDNWQNRTREVPVITSAGRSHVMMPKPNAADQVVNPNEIYAKVDKTRKKEAKSKTASPTYQNTEEIATTVVAVPKRNETKVTVEKTSPVEAEDIPRAIPNTNIAVAFVVTCCFNLPLGALAIYCSLVAAQAFRDGKMKKGERRTQISMLLSLFGILVTVLVVMGVVLHLAMSGAKGKKKRTQSEGARELDISL